MNRRARALSIVATLVAMSSHAFAQDDTSAGSTPRGAAGSILVAPKTDDSQPAKPAQAVLTPPIVKSDPGAIYPQQAIDDHVRETVRVVVIVEVDPQGHVRKVNVESPEGHGFDEAAALAASKLEFDPATKNGTPIAARIKHAYDFAPPPSKIVGTIRAQITGDPVAHALVKVRGSDGTEHSVESSADGSWQVDHLAAGKYHIAITASAFVPQESDQDLDVAQEVKILFRLSPVDKKTASTTKKAADDVEDVTVKGDRPPREATVRTIDQREMNRIPGTNGDALKSLQNLPGVARPPSFLGLLIVRGSAPQDTSIFVDGTLIPIVYHFGGLTSVIPTEMLEKIDFYPGNFSTQYGRAMGGIVDVGMRDPKKDGHYHFLFQNDFIDARIMAEGPIGNTGWNFLVGARRSYVDLWLKPILTATDAGVTAAPIYYDAQLEIEKDISKTSSFRVLLFGSNDNLAILLKSAGDSDPQLGGGLSAHTGFWRVQARYKNKFSDTGELRVTAAFGEDFVDFSVGDDYLDLKSFPLTLRAEIAEKIARGVTSNFGIDSIYAPYNVSIRFPPIPTPGEPPAGPGLSQTPLTTSSSGYQFRPGVYEELELTPWQGSRIIPGARLDYAKDTGKWDVSPRLVVRQDLTTGFPRTTVKAAAGVFAQPPQPQETNAVFGMTGLHSNRAIHYDVGVEQEITRPLEISVEGYYKQLDDLVVAQRGNTGSGRAFGLETLLRYKPDAHFFGWLAYTLSRSEMRDAPGLPLHLSPYDQTHILTVLGSYRLGRGWELGARFRLVSGSPYTAQTYGFYDENAGATLPLLAYPPDSQRLPIFHQLDIRVDKTWKLRLATLGIYLDVQNVYNQSNAEGVSYNYQSTKTTFVSGLPILPSLGFRGTL